jgi:putative transposase
MSQTRSPSTQRVYGLARVCRAWEVARSTVYAAQGRAAALAGTARRRGPKLRWSDEALLERHGHQTPAQVRARLLERSA